MDMQQLPTVNAGNNQKKSSVADNKTDLSNASASERGSSFKNKLNEQIDKNNNNQRDSLKKSAKAANTKENVQSDNGEGAAGRIKGGEEYSSTGRGDSKKEALTDGYNRLSEAAQSETQVDDQLPLSGILLPQSEAVMGRGASQLLAQEMSARLNNQAAGPFSKPDAGIPGVQIPGAGILEQLKPVPLSINSSSAPIAEALVVPALLQPAPRAADKTNMSPLQVTQSTAMESDIPVVDVIAQATRLQQVPVVTGLSENIAQVLQGAGNAELLTPDSPASSITATAVALSSPGTTSVNNTLANSLTGGITANLDSPDWSKQMTQQVSFMLKGDMQKAEIKLNPANLGPLEIKLSINDDKASISFVAQHLPVRDALEQAMPRLREMFDQQGLNLVDVDVSTQSEQQERQQANGAETADINHSEADESVDNAVSEQIHNITTGVESAVNIYA